jgi:glucosamine--fructose-6-phosphate aminotransferase (isomerizing)
LIKLGLRILAETGEGDAERLERLQRELGKLPQMAEEVLRSSDHLAKDLAERHSGKKCLYFAGAGPNYPNALEAALKIIETSYVPAQGFETEQLLHGPWVSLDKESVVFVLSPKGPSHERGLDLIRTATKLGSTVVPIIAQDDEEITSVFGNAIGVPVVDEILSPSLMIIPLYLFAYYMCLQRGHNPDYLRYLTPAYWEARQVIFPPGTH